MQHHPQRGAAQWMRPTRVILQQQSAATPVRLKTPMSDVVQNVERAGLKRPEQRARRRSLEPLKLYRASRTKGLQGTCKVMALALDVKAVVVRRAADDRKDPQRQLHQCGTLRTRQIEVAHHGRHGGHRQEGGIVKQVLPRNLD